jgi:hypothetical protein
MSPPVRILSLIVVGVIVWAAIDGPYVRQQRAMSAAFARKRELLPRLDADPRFASVKLSVSTAPALVVSGKVPGLRAASDLREIVKNPPDATYSLAFNVSLDGGIADP